MKHRTGTRSAWAALALCAVTSGARADDELARTVQAAYDNLTTFQARFEQVLETPTLGEPIRESGTVYVHKPGRMRWEYKKPEDKLALADGIRTYLYTPEEGQVVIGTLAELTGSSIAARLLAGHVSIAESFTVERLDRDGQRPGTWVVELTPLEVDPDLAYIVLEIDPDKGAIYLAEAFDPMGNRMRYRFRAVRVNPRLDDDLFVFRVPPDVEVQYVGSP